MGKLPHLMLQRGDHLEVWGRRRSDGKIRVRRITHLSTGTTTVVRLPMGMLAEYLARAAWVLLACWILIAIVAR